MVGTRQNINQGRTISNDIRPDRLVSFSTTTTTTTTTVKTEDVEGHSLDNIQVDRVASSAATFISNDEDENVERNSDDGTSIQVDHVEEESSVEITPTIPDPEITS